MTDEKSAIKHFRAASRVYKKERDSFRKQRDELINDMVEIRKKAEAFDEIERLVSKTKSAEDFGECVLQLLIENKEANHEG
ncbi:hypothetical protein B2G94_10100 [Staphylococcus hominis subsp. hominis]|nr:hypothetical protein B7P03_10265 [Staphylococcus hominis subsp. hominis]OUL45117.1 hypothetical protein B2G94_10100 [Staphylococcus hominis subsp. hominis]